MLEPKVELFMIVTFLGTRGNIPLASKAHQRHASTLIQRGRTSIMIDCGLDWLKLVHVIQPTAIILTHGHPDHVGGLRNGAPCPVYATRDTWEIIDSFAIKQRHLIEHRQSFKIGQLKLEPFFVQHSLIAPAVGYRISSQTTDIFCAHDIYDLPNQADALEDVILYIGDGASIIRPIARKSHGRTVGHTPIIKQLQWCATQKVPNAIFTHCGSALVRANQAELKQRIAAIASEQGVVGTIAYDGMTVKVKAGDVEY